MPALTEIAPNEPDAAPEFLDVRPDQQKSRHREGECVVNVPDAEPVFVSEEKVVISPAAAAAASASKNISAKPSASPGAGASANQTDAAATAATDHAKPTGKPVKSPFLRWHTAITLFLAAALGVLLCSQAISALALAATLPVWAQYLLLIPLGFCCLVLVGVAVSLVRAWLRLRTVTQVNLKTLEELDARAQTRRDGTGHFKAAKTALADYLAAYPAEGTACKLPSAGVSAAEIEKIVRERSALLGTIGDSRTWLEDFRDRFQTGLDAAARSRVKSWSLKAAGCVMASPVPFLDSVLVLGIACKMLRDLAVIYNVRASGAGTILLLRRAIVAAFVAGVAEDALEAAGSAAGEELTGVLGEGLLAGLGAGVARAAGPKLGEGAVNAFFIFRLGGAAVRILQPLRPK